MTFKTRLAALAARIPKPEKVNLMFSQDENNPELYTEVRPFDDPGSPRVWTLPEIEALPADTYRVVIVEYARGIPDD